jgi:hypothetical protein
VPQPMVLPYLQVVQKDAIPYDKQTGNLQTGVQFKLTDPSDVQPSVSLQIPNMYLDLCSCNQARHGM